MQGKTTDSSRRFYVYHHVCKLDFTFDSIVYFTNKGTEYDY